MSPLRVAVAAAVVLVAASPLSAAPPTLLASIDLPGSRNPTAFIGSPNDGVFFLAMRRSRQAELHAIRFAGDSSLVPLWSLDLPGDVEALALAGGRLFVVSGGRNAKLLVMTADAGQPLGSALLPPGRAWADAALQGEGLLRLARNRGPGPEIVWLDVTDPLEIEVMRQEESDSGFRPLLVPRVDDYEAGGDIIGRIDFATGSGVRSFLATTARHSELQVVERLATVSFEDSNRDGRFRLACLGDSNTAPAGPFEKWCGIIARRVRDPLFDLVIVAETGATLNPQTNPNLPTTAAAFHHLEEARALEADAVLLAYGTNDAIQGYTVSQIASAMAEHRSSSLDLDLDFFACAIPPMVYSEPSTVAFVEAANAEIAAVVPSSRFVDLHSGFGPVHFQADGIHVGPLGHELRAERALAKLLRD